MKNDLIFWGCVVVALLYSNRRWFFALKETTIISNELTGKTVIKKRRIQKPTKEQAELMEVAISLLPKPLIAKLSESADNGYNTDSVIFCLKEAGFNAEQIKNVQFCYEYIRAKKHFKL